MRCGNTIKNKFQNLVGICNYSPRQFREVPIFIRDVNLFIEKFCKFLVNHKSYHLELKDN